MFSCDSVDVCGCLDVPQIGPWYEDLCALAENFTATNATAFATATTNDDLLDKVDVFAVMIAILTAIAMVTLIWLSVLFARYRKRNAVVGALEKNIAVAQRENEEVQANLEEKLHDLERDADEALRRRAQEAEAREGALLPRAQSAEARVQDTLKQKEAALARERLSNEMRKSVRK